MPKMIPMRSSSVAAAGYDAERHELHVEFVDGDRYVYSMVPRSVFEALLDAESVGAFVNSTIKPSYPCRPAEAP